MCGLWTDQPILDTKQDRLNFSHYADALAEVVLTADTPITIGVFGPWGSGKTSLMKLVTKQLTNRRTAGHRWARVAWFNAWQYERDEGALGRALLLRVRQKAGNGRHYASYLPLAPRCSRRRKTNRNGVPGNW